jgi:N-ethylmaleimide reductase
MADMLLFSPVTLGALELRNRLVMAPMTRNRATPDGLPTPMMTTYYTQRASAGLIVTEMTQITPEAVGYMNTPGIHSAEQVAAWRTITEAVHAAGGRIAMQLGHAGRISHPLLIGGRTPVAPSAIRPDGKCFTPQGQLPYETPRALATDELPTIVAQFRHAAAMAKEAGFDGVELHSANGYLLDEFLRSGTNKRTDGYGGSVENRTRLLLEVASAASEVWGPGRVGVRVSPFNPFNSMHDDQPLETFPAVARLLDALSLAYLHISYGGSSVEQRPEMIARMRSAFGGPIIANAGYDVERAETALKAKEAEAIAFGVPFLANPDLPARFARGAELNAPDPATFYMGTEVGYIDYPSL